MIHKYIMPLATGNVTISSERPLNGLLSAIQIDYVANGHANTDVTLASIEPALTLYALSNNNTDTYDLPRKKISDEVSADVTYDGTNEVYEKMPIDGILTITVADNNANGTIRVTLWLEC